MVYSAEVSGVWDKSAAESTVCLSYREAVFSDVHVAEDELALCVCERGAEATFGGDYMREKILSSPPKRACAVGLGKLPCTVCASWYLLGSNINNKVFVTLTCWP